ESCRRWCQLYNESSPEFLAVAQKFGDALGVDSSSASGLAEIFGRMGKLRSCHEVGPHLKLMRFVSINDCWEWHRKELRGLRAVLKLMSDEHGKGGGLSTMVHAGTSRGATDGDVQQEISKQAGTVKRAYSFITDDLHSALSIFSVATSSQRQEYGHRSSQVKTIAQGMDYDYKLQTGAWKLEFRQTVITCMNDVAKIRDVGLLATGDPNGQRGAEAFEFMMRVLKERYDSIAPELFCYPGKFRMALGRTMSSQERLKVRRGIINFDWRLILEVEKATLSRPDAQQLVGDIFWLKWPINRLAFCQNERELGAPGLDDITDGFIRTASAALEHWPDSKGPEDVHQHIRDEGRAKREPTIGPTRLYRAQQEGNIAGSRGMKTFQLSDEDVSRNICHRDQQVSVAKEFRGDVSYFRMRSDAGAFHDYYVTNPTNYKVANISKVTFLAGVGRVLLVSEEPMTPLAASLLAGAPLALDHMKNIADVMGLHLDDAATASAGAAREKLIELTFAGFPDLIAKCAAALHKQGDFGAEELGDDFMNMLDEILAHDAQNCNEIQTFRTALKQQNLKRMAEKRKGRREAKKAAADARVTKKIAKGKLAAGIGAKLVIAKAAAAGAAGPLAADPAGGPVGGLAGAGGAAAGAAIGGCGGGGGAPSPAPLPPAPPGGLGVGVGGPDGSGDAPPLPPPPKKAKVGGAHGAHGQKKPRAEPFGPWQIAEIWQGGICVGWEGRCLDHLDPAKPKFTCVKHVHMGKGTDNRPALSYDTCRRRMKQWLLVGRGIPKSHRDQHVFMDARANDLLPNPEAELGAAAEAELLKRERAAT
ncbi:unnamed protein product, partial [Prorocentrum cordatum]